MRIPKLRMAALALVGGVSLSGCAYDMGYGGYGSPYSSVSLGVGYGGGYGYADPYYGGYGYGSPFGWYDDFYYPGTGVYVYDSYRRPHYWNDRQRRYWSHRSGGSRWGHGGNWSNSNVQPNWGGFSHRDRPTGFTIRGQKYDDGHRR